MLKIGFIGFGEAARAFTKGFKASNIAAEYIAYDIKTINSDTKAFITDACLELGVTNAASNADVMANADIILSMVTADSANAAALEASTTIRPGTFFFDCNSCSPGAKQKSAKAIDLAGGRYVDVAVMSPVYPNLNRTPCLFSGQNAEKALEIAGQLSMRARFAGTEVGQASSIKMLRSVMIKGMEALTAECFIAARKAGVEQQILDSLDASDPGLTWAKRAAYNLERMMVHGVRRAAEMDEVAATLRDLGLPDRMSAACASWQREIGAKKLDAGEDNLASRATTILASLEGK
jgi:3-hydroxyisobutyrate dehydrogenase-like beta-hydroxyacid dehydrogenase